MVRRERKREIGRIGKGGKERSSSPDSLNILIQSGGKGGNDYEGKEILRTKGNCLGVSTLEGKLGNRKRNGKDWDRRKHN